MYRLCVGKLFIATSVMLARLNSDSFVFSGSASDVCFTASASLISAVTKVAAKAGGML